MLKYEYRGYMIEFHDENGNEFWVCNVDEKTKIQDKFINSVKQKIDNLVNDLSNYSNVDAFCLEFNSSISKVKVRSIDKSTPNRMFWVEDETGLRSRVEKVFACTKNNGERIDIINRLRDEILDKQSKVKELLNEMDVL